ncbi:MAG TPA: hypothetical protein VIX86_04670 [Streptosporangiaceae bacterium]
MTVQTATAPVWASRAGDTPGTLADLFRQAAHLIEAEGYSPCADGVFVHGRRPGHSVTTALDAAAAYACENHPADAADLAEDAHARLAGFLHLTGLRTRRTSIHDLCNEVAAWEDCRPGAGYRSQAEAVAVLDAAARLLDALGGAR